MDDPREIISEDELTADENEELINLQKEYELKKKDLLEKKASKFHENLNTRQVKKVDFEKRIFSFELPTLEKKEVDETEPLTGIPIRLRYYKHDEIIHIVKDIKLMNVNKVLAKITKPDYKEPNYNNWAFIGFVVDKSKLLKTIKGEKYLKLRIGNFSHTVSVNLFGEGYSKYWQLPIGELVIILNPNIHKNPKGFDFFISENLNNILSIGMVKNIGKCKDDKCTNYIDPKDQYCDFHQSIQEKKFLKNKRMELNGSVKLFNPLQKRSEYLKELNEESKIFHMKSNFNSEKFVDENYFRKQGSKRKLEDEKSKRNLEEKLMALGGRAKYENLGLLKKTKISPIKSDSKPKLNLKEELKSLTKGKKINLGMSKQDKIHKKQKWDKNMNILNNKQVPPKEVTLESDDELNIVVNKSNYDLMKSYEKYKNNT
ncbi:minichromosome maintenance protein 10 [[Candida] jaroonii]|uniref:Minichromosome maintenance protein 10 n=1 Tax=[Candida] jaroonii TaxID=467808 RepID=A0ACA9YDQ3_9ASCO|nr:minichromosome maintenance protein 10 [[Candida] jaroonii]